MKFEVRRRAASQPFKGTRPLSPAESGARSRKAAVLRTDQASLSPRVPFKVVPPARRTTPDSQKRLSNRASLLSSQDLSTLSGQIWKFYKEHGRHTLPWRQPDGRNKKYDPYKILVSEVMLQQTQVDRVIPFYKNFLKKFPNVRALAKAPLSDVLIAWQGLGYNRRAKMLHLAAKEVVEKYKGTFPDTVEELEKLPGIGHYTARAIATFAYNQPVVFIETNLRTVITHHFFADREQVDDLEILFILEQLLEKQIRAQKSPRDWYAALMDYGSYLKRSGVRINAKSKAYTKQSKFTGSDREARGAILRALAKGSQTKVRLLTILGDDRIHQMEVQLKKLISESMVASKNSQYHLSS